jgi:hypothetical protein
MNPKKWLRQRYDRGRLAWTGKFGHIYHPGKWVFIVGCYNSGTTLLHNVLASLPDVAHLPREGQYCTDQLLVPSTVGLARSWALHPELFTLDATAKNAPDTDRLQRQWCSMMSAPDCNIYLEKSIPNAARIPWLNARFPNACFIGIVRNGYVVAEGIRRKADRPLAQGARQWAVANDIMLQDLKSVERAHVISYEDFTESPEQIMSKLLSFLELPASQNMMQGKEWVIHGVQSSIKNMNQASLQRLSKEDRQIIESEAGSLLGQLGYLEGAEVQLETGGKHKNYL